MKLCISTSISRLNFLLKTSAGNSFSSENNMILESDPIDLLTDLLKNSKKEVSDITDIFIDIGPGGTSSTRTGVSVSNALAYALSIPSYPVLSSELIYSYALKQNESRKWIVISRSIKGNVFCFTGSREENYLKKLTYGALSLVLEPHLETTSKNISIITDMKTEKDIKRKFPILNESNFYCELYKVNIEHFGSICENFNQRSTIFPNLIVPVTENQIINE